MTEENNLSMVQGDDYSKIISIKKNNVAEDITGWTIYFTIKNKKTDVDADAIYQQEITTHTSPADGVSQISIPHATSINFEVDSYYFDIQTKDTDDIIKTPVRGTFIVNWGITDKSN